MKIVVDRELCAGHGVCESIAPDFFEVSPKGTLLFHAEEIPDERLAAIDAAISSCPMGALSRIEDEPA